MKNKERRVKNEEFFCFSSLWFENERKLDKTKLLIATKVKGQSVGSSQSDCPFSFSIIYIKNRLLNSSLFVLHSSLNSRSYQTYLSVPSHHPSLLQSMDIHLVDRFHHTRSRLLPYPCHQASQVPSFHSFLQ